MSRLRELIAELCPDGVEYVELGKLADIGTGRSDRKDAVDDGLYPFYVRSQDVFRKNDYEYDEEAILVPGEGGIGQVFHYVNGKYALHQRVYRIHVTASDVLTMFIKRYMESEFLWFITREAVTATVKSIRKPMLQKFRVPVPPIEVQREIVRILDSFQELDDALTAEIEAREKQLDAMRASIYSDVTYPMAKLGDIGRFERGKRFTRSQMGGDGVPCIHYGDIYTKCKYWTNAPIDRLTDNAPATLRYASKGDVVIAATSENVEDVCTAIVWDCGERAAVHDDCQIYHHEQNPLYIALFFNSGPFVAQKMRFVTESKVVRISGAEMAQTTIPLPPVSVQNRIAQNMADSIYLMDCLRSEREARRKQFAYYRDKLLSFPERPREVVE